MGGHGEGWDSPMMWRVSLNLHLHLHSKSSKHILRLEAKRKKLLNKSTCFSLGSSTLTQGVCPHYGILKLYQKAIKQNTTL
jgi:hypothetical protein